MLSAEHARIRFQASRHPDASEEQRAAWAAEEARVTRAFRALAERMGILRLERSRDTDPEVRARRDDVWAEVSDGSRAMLFSMADPTADVGASSKARSFLPRTDEFREPYNAIDNFTYFVEEHAAAGARVPDRGPHPLQGRVSRVLPVHVGRAAAAAGGGVRGAGAGGAAR